MDCVLIEVQRPVAFKRTRVTCSLWEALSVIEFPSRSGPAPTDTDTGANSKGREPGGHSLCGLDKFTNEANLVISLPPHRAE